MKNPFGMFAIAAMVLVMGACSEDEISSLPESIVGSSSCAAQGTASPATVSYFDRGWWSQEGEHDPANDFVFLGFENTGSGYQDLHAYVQFDVSPHIGKIQSATLRLTQETWFGVDASEVMTIRPVSTSPAVLDSDATSIFNPSVHTDLGDGVPYGGATLLQSNFGSGTIIDIPLSNQAVCDLNSAPSGQFAVGLRVDSLSRVNGATEGFRLGLSGGGINDLALMAVP